MKPQNVISVLRGAAALETLGDNVQKGYKVLKPHEIRTMTQFCQIMQSLGCKIVHFDGFYVSYTIQQINKEFDLLRFSKDSILNIEIKSELKTANKEDKILQQMRKNFYYLKFLGKKLLLFAYVEKEGFFRYNGTTDTLERVSELDVAERLMSHTADYSVDPDVEFVPSSYLISPFNSTERFMDGEYFLTQAQEKRKTEMNEELLADPFMFFCLSANAGTGKTLLLYDIAKQCIAQGNRPLIIHCGILNEGQEKLINQYHWNILSIRSINWRIPLTALDNVDLVLIDESQRIRTQQLNAIINKAVENKVPIIFSYDTNQYLKEGETRNIADYLASSFPNIKVSVKKLSNKIRTNKQLASFISNLMQIGREKENMSYECISIDYMDTEEELMEYIQFLRGRGWMPITYTTSQYYSEPYDHLIPVSEKTAHAVIGQEFSKVVLVMDQNFMYSETGKLLGRQSYYSASGMLYQIVTRVVDELKIIVLDNPDLYYKLQTIKAMGQK